MIGTDEPSASASAGPRAPDEALNLWKLGYHMQLTDVYTPVFFCTHISTNMQAHALSLNPACDGWWRACPRNWWTGVGELCIDGQDDVQLSGHEPTLAGGNYSAESFYGLFSPLSFLLYNMNKTDAPGITVF